MRKRITKILNNYVESIHHEIILRNEYEIANLISMPLLRERGEYIYEVSYKRNRAKYRSQKRVYKPKV